MTARRWYWPWLIALFWLFAAAIFGCGPFPEPKTVEEDAFLHTHQRLVGRALLIPADVPDGYLLCFGRPPWPVQEREPVCRSLGDLRHQLFGPRKHASVY